MLRWPVNAPKTVNAVYCSALALLIIPLHSALRMWPRIRSMSSLVTMRLVTFFRTLIRRGLSKNNSNERYRKSRCILAKYFRKPTANVKTLLFEDSHSYFASVFFSQVVDGFCANPSSCRQPERIRSPVNPIGRFACKLCFPVLRVALEFIKTKL